MQCPIEHISAIMHRCDNMGIAGIDVSFSVCLEIYEGRAQREE
jgi:hypothetical protein